VGAVPVRAPRVNEKRIDEAAGEPVRFSSAIVPAWARRSPQVAQVLPLLYLHGLSSSDFGPALEQFLGSGAGLSASTITRLTTQWQEEQIRKVVRTTIEPVINTGIASLEPGVGQIGAGTVRAPMQCFVKALEALAERYGVSDVGD